MTMNKIEINHYWTKLDVGCGKITILKNQSIQLTVDDEDDFGTYVDLDKYEAKAISDMLLLAIGELSELEFEQKYNNK